MDEAPWWFKWDMDCKLLWKWFIFFTKNPLRGTPNSRILSLGFLKSSSILFAIVKFCQKSYISFFETLITSDVQERFGIYNGIARHSQLTLWQSENGRMRLGKFPHLWPLQIHCKFNRNTLQRMLQIQYIYPSTFKPTLIRNQTKTSYITFKSVQCKIYDRWLEGLDKENPCTFDPSKYTAHSIEIQYKELNKYTINTIQIWSESGGLRHVKKPPTPLTHANTLQIE